MRVGQMVRQLVVGCGQNIHAKRLDAVVKAVQGIVQAGRLCPASIGRNLPGKARPKHGIKCVDRLLANARLAREFLYLFCAIAHHLLQGCSRPVILVDWTKVADGYEALVAAVPIGGRALPIYIEVHPLKKLGNAAVEERFLLSLGAILPPHCRPVVVSDAGYKGPFFRAVLALSWDFVGRIRGTSTASADPHGPSIPKEAFYAKASTTPSDLGRFELFTKQRIPCRLVVVRKRRKPGPKRPPPKCKETRESRQAALDPWLLATSLTDEDAASVVSVYAKRMQIEETFRDAKNHRFGWSLRDVRTSNIKRARVLLMLATVALVTVTLIGMNAEQRGIHRAYQANTARQRVLSFFTLACAILRRDDDPCFSLECFRTCLTRVWQAAEL